MANGYQIIDILIFAAIAAFFIIRLRSVLGKRTGHSKRQDFDMLPPASSSLREGKAPFRAGREKFDRHFNGLSAILSLADDLNIRLDIQ